MAKFLQKLLTAKAPLFSTAIHNLERSTGYAGVDTRLIGDVIRKAHGVMRVIGLDPADTTALELYNCLRSRPDIQNLLAETNYVGMIFDNEVISFNSDDVTANISTDFSKRSVENMQHELELELVARYNDHARTDERVVRAFIEDAGLRPWYNHSNEQQKQIESEKYMDQPYILSIGDIVTDAFIKLRDDQAEVTTDEHGNKRLSMEFGSKPPYDHVDIIQAVGNSANASVAFARLGLRTSLMAFLGDDQPGKDSLDYLASENVDTKSLSVTAGMKSNYHYALRYGADRTILIKYEDYDYAWQEPEQVPDWVYLSMISASAWQLHVDALAYLKKHPTVKLVFQPGTFHFEWGTEKLAEVYARTHIIFMNREEAALVTGKSADSISVLADALHALGPEIVVITDGPNGAYASDGTKLLVMPNYPDPAPPNDRTGAGDAFASTMVAALAGGETLETALRWAPINSMSVVQQLGAQAGLLRRSEIDAYLASAPEDYIPKDFN